MLKGGRAACLSLRAAAGLMLCAGSLCAQPLPASVQVIAPSEQTARDKERIDILRQELRKSEEQLESLVRRRAERLALSDTQAVNEADEQHARLLGDIAGLKREMASMVHATGRALPTRPVAGYGRHRAIAGWNESPAPWWDVYGNGQTARLPASPAAAPAPAPWAGPANRSLPSAGVAP